jgi:hypothetical protein
MRFWEENALLFNYPFLEPLILSNFFRGAVSGLGLSNIILGVWEIAHFKYYFGREKV